MIEPSDATIPTADLGQDATTEQTGLTPGALLGLADPLCDSYGARKAATLLHVALSQLAIRFPRNASLRRLKHDAHALGGSIGFLGYTDLASACGALEQAIDGDAGHDDALAVVETLVAKTWAEITARLEKIDYMTGSWTSP